MANIISDIHCHPTLKPFGRSVTGNSSTNPKDKSSVWYYDKPNLAEKLLEKAIGIARYTQSDFTSCAKGNVKIIGTSLYAPEVKFFENNLGEGEIADLLESFVTDFGQKRIDQIEGKNYDYFTDVLKQYQFLQKLDGKEVLINGEKHKYKLVNSWNDIHNCLNSSENILAVFITIEGGHAFGCGKDPIHHPTDEITILKNVDKILNWKNKPCYLTLAHHFYNELCGHSKSIPDGLDLIIDQSYGMDWEINSTGMKVIEKLISPKRPVLIDVKHMSIKARKQYYDLLKTFPDIPVIYSHGGVNGLKSFENENQFSSESLFNQGNLSLFDNEIIIIAQSKGLIGLNMDQRVMASKYARKLIKHSLSKKVKLAEWSRLIWNNIEHIAEILDKKGLPAWDNICLGTDYDGQINPVNYFWTEEYLPVFQEQLEIHASNFIKAKKISSANRLSPDEICQKIMVTNTINFLKKNFV